MSWRYVGASVIGTSHADQDLPCQDASLVRLLKADVLLLTASDGAGSAPCSDLGARLACDTLLEEVASYVENGGAVGSLTSETIDGWCDAVIGKLHLQARIADRPPRDFACTLITALLGPDASAYLHLGDGAIVALIDDAYSVVSWPRSGEYANTTFFLTDDRAMEQFQVHLQQPPVEELALFTDGLQMLALQFSSRTAHVPFFRPLFERLRSESPGEATALGPLLEEYLASPTITSRTDDDKTLLLATRHAAVESQPLSSEPSGSADELSGEAGMSELTRNVLEPAQDPTQLDVSSS